MKTTTTLVSIAMVSLTSLCTFGATCTALMNGDWTNPGTWSCGSVPGCGDLIEIPVGITVNLDDHVNLDETSMPPCSNPIQIIIFGILDFSSGKKMYLSCGSTVEVMPGGEIQPGTGGGSSNLLYICQQEEWRAEDGKVVGYKLFGTPLPLALELATMEISLEAETLSVSWSVENELLVDYYEIRVSYDGSNWEKKHVIERNKDGNQSNEYSYSINLDASILSDYVYVQLTYYTYDGKRNFIALRLIENTRDVSSVYPNPVSFGQLLTIQSAELTDNSQLIEVYSAEGQLKNTINAKSMNSTLQLSVDDLESGFYFIRIQDSKELLRFVKQ